MISIKYLLVMACISPGARASLPSNNNLFKRRQIIRMLKVSKDITQKISQAPIGDISHTCEIFELYHQNEIVKEKKEEMLIFGVFNRSELLKIDKEIESTEKILDQFEQKITKGLKIVYSLELLHAKMAKTKKKKGNEFPIHHEQDQ